MKSILFIAFLVVSASGPADSLYARIIGGESIDISEVPWLVSLQEDGFPFCGGSIIAEKWVVTAAHCTIDHSASELYLRAGSSTPKSGGQVVDVVKIYQNPNYDDEEADYDIAVLEVAPPFRFNDKVAPVNLPSSSMTWPAGTKTFVVGWGATVDGEVEGSPELLGVEVEIVDIKDCRTSYKGYKITDRMLCAGVTGGGKDSCQGDSGGPLVVDETLIGVVSWGLYCGRAGYPGIYANVAVLRSFIQEITGI